MKICLAISQPKIINCKHCFKREKVFASDLLENDDVGLISVCVCVCVCVCDVAKQLYTRDISSPREKCLSSFSLWSSEAMTSLYLLFSIKQEKFIIDEPLLTLYFKKYMSLNTRNSFPCLVVQPPAKESGLPSPRK
jgi:hypothetical protein